MDYLTTSFARQIGRQIAMAICLVLMTLSAQAEPFVKTTGKLSDLDFYRLVSCGAEPGGDCRNTPYRWSLPNDRTLTIGIVAKDPNYPARHAKAVQEAIENTINEINGLGAGLRLAPPTSEKPDITVRLEMAITPKPAQSTDLNDILNSMASGAWISVKKRGQNGPIVGSDITITPNVERRRVQPVFLSVTLTSLGLKTLIHNRSYKGRSVFSATGTIPRRMRGQDAMVLRSHYPNN